LLLAGVIVPLVPLGVAGFVVMLAAASFGVASWQRMTGHRTTVVGGEHSAPGRSTTKVAKRSVVKRSVLKRLEERWERRQGDR
jgi:hypothetical protein